MADKIFTGLQLPSLTGAQARNADAGFLRLYFKDEELYAVNSAGGDLNLSGSFLDVGLIDSSNVSTNVVSSVSSLRFGTDGGFTVEDLGSGQVKVSLNSTFKYWSVAGQNTVIAEGLDTVELVAGDNIIITTNAAAKSVEFATSNTLAEIVISETAPSGAGTGDLWFDPSNLKTYIYYNDSSSTQWVEIGGSTVVSTSGSISDANLIYDGVISEHLIPDTDVTYDLGTANNRFRDLYLSGNTIYLGDTTFSTDKILDFDLAIDPEVFRINVDFPLAGHGYSPNNWKWTWDAGRVAYTRLAIRGIDQASVPLYAAGEYTVFNFAAHEMTGNMTQTHKIYLKWIEGAGLDNVPTWSTSTLNVTGISHPQIRGGAATEVQRLFIDIPDVITPPTLVAPNVEYDVSVLNIGAFTFSGTAMGDNPTLGPVYRGGTYTFNLDVSGHPFYLTTDNGNNFSSGTYYGEYTDGVTGSRNQTGTLVLNVANDAPNTIFYQCGVHSSMRGEIEVRDLEVETWPNGNYKLYFQHDQEGHSTPVEIKPKPTINDIDNVCLIYDGARSKFKVKDMGEYVDDTVQFQSKIEDIVTTQTVNNVTANQVSTQIRDEIEYVINSHTTGTLDLLTGTKRWYAPYNITITEITANLGVAADDTVTAVINSGGSSLQTINITAGQLSTTLSGLSLTVNSGGYLTIDVTAVGTTNKGEDLYIQIKYRRT